MLNHPLYNQLTQMIFGQGWTIEQVKNMDYWQARSLLSPQRFTGTFFENMKGKIVEAFEEQALQNRAAEFSARLASLLDKNARTDHGREDGKAFITIWPEGKPNVNLQ